MSARRAVLLLVALSALLQILPAGVGVLYNETDGQYAGAAKRMVQGGSWLVPENNGEPRLVKPPLLYWMMASSFRAFGLNEFAARLPGALGVLAWALATFAIGARLRDVRHGFTAGVVLLTLLGTATLGRIVMPEPVFCALIAWAIYCGIAAMESGSGMAVLFWLFAALAAFAKGVHGLLYPLATLGLAAAFVREWKFRRLLSPAGIGLFLAINLPWYLYVESKFPGWLASWVSSEQVGHLAGSEAPATHYENVPRWQFLVLHLAWFFPWSVVALVMLGSARLWQALRGILPRNPPGRMPGGTGWKPVLPVLLAAWAAVVVLPLLLMGQRQDYYAMAAWPVFALWVAGFRERPRAPEAASAILAALCAAGLLAASLVDFGGGSSAGVAERATAWTTVLGFGPEVWSGMRWLGVAAFSLALLPLVAGLALGRFHFPALAASASVLSLFAVLGYAFVAPYFSLASAAPLLNAPAFYRAPIVFDGGLDTASSLLFYSNRTILLVDPKAKADGFDRAITPEEFAALWQSGVRVDFVTEAAKTAGWGALLGPLPEPAATSGTQVVFRHGE